MMRHFSKILPGLMRDVLDWVLETRIKSASLLYTLLLNTEDYVTQHLEPLLMGMYRASVDEDQRVVNHASNVPVGRGTNEARKIVRGLV